MIAETNFEKIAFEGEELILSSTTMNTGLIYSLSVRKFGKPYESKVVPQQQQHRDDNLENQVAPQEQENTLVEDNEEEADDEDECKEPAVSKKKMITPSEDFAIGYWFRACNRDDGELGQIKFCWGITSEIEMKKFLLCDPFSGELSLSPKIGKKDKFVYLIPKDEIKSYWQRWSNGAEVCTVYAEKKNRNGEIKKMNLAKVKKVSGVRTADIKTVKDGVETITKKVIPFSFNSPTTASMFEMSNRVNAFVSFDDKLKMATKKELGQ
jgi:hypothetical protein